MSKIHTQLYKQLLIESVRDSLPGKPTFPLPPLTIVELGQLMTLASQLACSTSAKSKTHSYEIATRVVEITKGSISGLNAAAELVLARIGNFPGQQLLRNRYVRNGESALKKHLYLALEAAARRAENTVNGADGNLVAFTDFQYDFYDALESTRSVSISAPTSAGKSYVLSLDIIRKIKNGTPTSVVYLVPTRALIRQVSLKIIKDLHTAGLRRIPVRCVPIPVDRSKFPQGAVYVLTQERLMSLLTPRDGEPWITSLIVDEAQGLRDGDRGIILHSAIDAVLDRFPKASVFFASPMAKNPEYLLELFDRSRASKHWVELHSPVSQNLILVTEAANSNRHVTFYINTRGPRITIGTHELGFVFQQARVFERRANFAKSVTRENESSIIYADRPSGTERIASELIKNEPEPDVVDPDIADLVNFLTVHIHPEYSLIKFLRYRIAFHYGAMPSIVRSRIEDLCSAGKLKFICCTSTLLQGINLPAKNIIMERPCKGTGEAMERGDFLNLSGRAGRMLKEFHGNVWCLRPDRWAKKSFEGEPLQEIESRFEETLSDHSNPIVNAAISEISGGTDSSGVVALGKVFSEFTQAGKSLVTSKYRTDQNENALREIEEKCAQIIVTLPAELFRRNAAISPVRIQDLYDYLKDQPELDSPCVIG
jgi:replicative superfamily II helicase